MIRHVHRRPAAFLLTLWVLLMGGLTVAAPAAASAFTEAVQARLLHGVGTPTTDRDGQDLQAITRFYEGRHYQPLWVGDGRPNAKATSLLAALQHADAEGLDPRRYGVARIATLLDHGDSPDALAELELVLTKGAIDLGRDLATGRLEPSRIDPEIFMEKGTIDAQILLMTLADNPDPAAVLLGLAPSRPEYVRLRQALVQYRAYAAAGGWPQVPLAEASLKPGESDERLPLLRQRLRVTGELLPMAPVPTDPHFYDPATVVAVELFQTRHGLEPDGVLGKQTLQALNVTASQRVAQIMMNMERWRWMPRDLGPAYILVNLAAFDLSIFDHGQIVHRARVVVGATSTRTPVFSRKMSYLEVNPYWHVPAKIVRDEIFPKAKRDPSYLAAHGYELLSNWSEDAVAIDPATLDWAHMRSLPYRVRQKPGDRNSLGRIKMMFPNEFDVYLHDTPSKSLFNRARRSFSHGCIRVEHPFDVAETILRLTGTSDWDRARLDATLATGQRTVVRLKQPIPIHMTYVTSFVADDGTVNFRSDLYGRDRRLEAAMQAAGIRPAQVAAEGALPGPPLLAVGAGGPTQTGGATP